MLLKQYKTKKLYEQEIQEGIIEVIDQIIMIFGITEQKVRLQNQFKENMSIQKMRNIICINKGFEEDQIEDKFQELFLILMKGNESNCKYFLDINNEYLYKYKWEILSEVLSQSKWLISNDYDGS